MKKIKTIQQKIRANIKKARTTRKAPSRKVEAPQGVQMTPELVAALFGKIGTISTKDPEAAFIEASRNFFCDVERAAALVEGDESPIAWALGELVATAKAINALLPAGR